MQCSSGPRPGSELLFQACVSMGHTGDAVERVHRAARAIDAGCSDARDGAKGVMQKSGQRWQCTAIGVCRMEECTRTPAATHAESHLGAL